MSTVTAPQIPSLLSPRRSGGPPERSEAEAPARPQPGPVDRFQPAPRAEPAPLQLYRPPTAGPAPTQATGDAPLADRLKGALGGLGVSERQMKDLMVVAEMLERISPEAAERLVSGLEAMAQGAAGPATPAGGPAAGPAGTGAASVSIRQVSLSISITEVSAESSEAGASVSARQLEVRFESLEIGIEREMAYTDPLVLDVDGDGFELRETDEGVVFDLKGDGSEVFTAFVKDDDALLFFDENKNGRIDDGGELVGNRIEGKNGFEELALLDDDGDGKITSSDAAWKELRLAQDRDADGRVSQGEVALLEELGISELSTAWRPNEREDGVGLARLGDGGFTRTDGSQGVMLDYMFGHRPV